MNYLLYLFGEIFNAYIALGVIFLFFLALKIIYDMFMTIVDLFNND